MNTMDSMFAGVLAMGGAGGPMLVAKATVVLVAIWLASLALRHAAASARHLVWLMGIVALLTLPLLARVALVAVPIFPSVPGVAAASAPTATAAAGVTSPGVGAAAAAVRPADDSIGQSPLASGLPGSMPITTPAPAPNQSLGSAARVAQLFSHPGSLLLWLWLSGVVALFAWLLIGVFSVRRIVRGGRELTSPEWSTPIHEIADRLDLADVPHLVMSERVEMAFVCDLLHPTVVLPVSAEEWSDDFRRAVLLHELAHVRRRDLVSHALGRVACALYWFHPMVWAAARRLRAESECACDDIVLTCGARASDYAQQLLLMVTSVRSSGAPSTALAMARRKEFEGRMLAILDPALPRTPAGRARSLALVGPFALLLVAVAAVAPVRRTSAIPEQTVRPSAIILPASPTSNTTPAVSSTPGQTSVVAATGTSVTPGTPGTPGTAARTTQTDAAAMPAPVRDRTLGAPTAVGDEPFRDIRAVRELSDGRLVVVQTGPPTAAITNMMARFGLPGDAGGGGRGRGNAPNPDAATKVVLLDAKLKNAAPIGQVGTEPNEYENPGALFAAPRDTTLIAQMLSTNLLVVDPKGAIVGSRPLGGGLSSGAQLEIGGSAIDRDGRLIYQGSSPPVTQTVASGMHIVTPDSAPILAFDFKTGVLTPLAQVRVAGQNMTTTGFPGQPGTTMHSKDEPFPTLDDWVLMPDGTVAIIRGTDMHIDWIAPNGKRRSTSPLPYIRVPVSDSIKTKYLADRHAEATDSNFKRATAAFGMVEDDPDSFPQFKPPFSERGAKAASDGTIWLPSKILSPSAPAGYDVIDHDGRLVERIHLAAGQKLLGFGKGVVYVSMRDSLRVTRVGRVPLH